MPRRLRTGRPLRKRRRRADQRRVRFVAPALLLDRRPAAVEQRVRVGDWEGDLLVGRMSQSAIGTLVDRTSRYLKLVHLPAGHSAEQLWLALTEVMRRLPQQARLTLTGDQGSEMACHDRVAEHFAEGVYFAHPASPWQRGTNENTNGLLASTSPSAPTSASTPWPTCSRSRSASTTAPQSPRLADPRPDLPRRGDKMSPSTLRRSLESALEPARRQGVSFRPSLTAVTLKSRWGHARVMCEGKDGQTRSQVPARVASAGPIDRRRPTS